MQRRSKLLLENKGHRLKALLEKQTKPKHIGAIRKRGKILKYKTVYGNTYIFINRNKEKLFTVKLSSLGGTADINYSSLHF